MTPETPNSTLQPEAMIVYTDPTYPFSLRHPAGFVVRAQPPEKLAQLSPAPTAAWIFMNPSAASSQIADLEPADLEIRVYASRQDAALNDWLTSHSLLPADNSVPLKPFRISNASGVQLCSSTMIAPACSYFVTSGNSIYQFIPATQAGEAMLATVQLAS